MHNTQQRVIMCAPNGARRGKADHSALPVQIDETVACAKQVWAKGANALHAHVRDNSGAHVLDSGLYKELLAEMEQQLPEMLVQITTEAIGIYSAQQQAQVVREVMPKAVSVALREMMPEGENCTVGHDFYCFAQEAGIAVQHILYDAADLERLVALQDSGKLPQSFGSHLYVLGRYAKNQLSDPRDLLGFLSAREKLENTHVPFMCCAFGQSETAALTTAMALGGHARVGFENSLWNGQGLLALDNAERVAEVSMQRKTLGFGGPDCQEQVLCVLGG
ncbi:3-keto-5-aminohexanoate cleavage protein [Polycladidibacter stylochi]|uniref:3-keto-5-aminohexanoate cleavage protein n=1 Tax=Polycladidibacter stylochi TaxID=1807766 RepID=UPI000834463E|nr:3-keto-5-aminohexanoate cleavage protein [Pseudovibrio stylochi]